SAEPPSVVNGVGSVKLTTNWPVTRKQPAAASAASATSGSAMRSDFMAGVLSGQAEDRVRGADGDVHHLPRHVLVDRALDLAAEVERQLRERRDPEPDTELVGPELLVLAGALELRLAEAGERVERQRAAHRQHRVQSVGGDVRALAGQGRRADVDLLV